MGWLSRAKALSLSCHCHLCTYLPLRRLREGDGGTAYDTQSASVIRLNNSTVLYLREVNKYLALVCLLREDSFEKQGQLAGGGHQPSGG